MSDDLFCCPVCDREFDSNSGRSQHFTFHDHDVKVETLIGELQKISEDLGRPITSADANDHGPFSRNMYRSVFGTWNNALKESGLDVQGRVDISDEELLDEIRRLDMECESTPAISDMEESGKFSSGTYYDRFDSWEDVIERAGVENTRGVTDDELISDIQYVAESLEKVPTQVEVSERTNHGTKTFHKHFGSWNQALVEAGFTPRSTASRDDLLYALLSLSQDMGGTPTRNQMNTSGKYSAPTYREMFGSWNKALEAADLRINKSPNGIRRSGVNYGPNWDSIRESVRTRDNNQCRVCGKPRSDSTRSTQSVHHITPARQFGAHDPNVDTDYSEMNSMSNLISLCQRCHVTFEGKWTDTNQQEFARYARAELNGLENDTQNNAVSD